MTIFLDINDNQLTMRLKKGKAIVDELVLAFQRDLDRQLISGLDKLFKRNRLDKLSLDSVEIASNIDKKSSFYRILLVFKKGLGNY